MNGKGDTRRPENREAIEANWDKIFNPATPDNRPPFETFKYATCRGSVLLGTDCGTCERCVWERQYLAEKGK